MKKFSYKWLNVMVMIACFSILYGCQAMDAEIHHSTLHTDSKMSNAIFLDQLSKIGNNVYVRVINTSTTSLNGLTDEIKQHLTTQGYKIVANPRMADYLLQVDILQFGKADMREYDKLYKKNQNFDETALTAVGTGVGTAMLGANAGTTIGVAAGTALLSWLANDLVENETYSLITNVQIEEIENGKVMHKYNTQIASKADKVDLKFAEAKPALLKQIAQEIAAIFGEDN